MNHHAMIWLSILSLALPLGGCGGTEEGVGASGAALSYQACVAIPADQFEGRACRNDYDELLKTSPERVVLPELAIDVHDPQLDPDILQDCRDTGFYCAGRRYKEWGYHVIADSDTLVVCKTGELVQHCTDIERQEYYDNPYGTSLDEKPYLSRYTNYCVAAVQTRPSEVPLSIYQGPGCYEEVNDRWYGTIWGFEE